MRQERLPPLLAIAWLGCSTLAYTIAALSVMILARPLEDLLAMGEEPAIALCGLAAGTLRGAVLASATRLLIPDTRWLMPTIVGGFLGLALLLFDERMGVGTFGFYILWQAGYAASLARALPAGNCPGAIVTRPEPRIESK